MSAMRRALPALLVSASLGLAACTANPGSGSDGERLQVVATTTVIADLAAQVGDDRVTVSALVPPGGEVHTFDPSPADIARLTGAGIILANGLGIDEWLADLAADAGAEAPVIELGEDLEGVRYRQAAEDDDHGGIDPHLWQNVAYAQLYVERIADELSAIDPAGATSYAQNAEAYVAELEELDAFARQTMAELPEGSRRLVSLHEAFGYFAEAYGLQLVGTVIEVPGQDPSAGEVATLIDEIRSSGARAILAEAQFPTSLAERIAEEADIEVIRDLHSDSLGPAPADTYVGMVRSNVERIAQALR